MRRLRYLLILAFAVFYSNLSTANQLITEDSSSEEKLGWNLHYALKCKFAGSNDYFRQSHEFFKTRFSGQQLDRYSNGYESFSRYNPEFCPSTKETELRRFVEGFKDFVLQNPNVAIPQLVNEDQQQSKRQTSPSASDSDSSVSPPSCQIHFNGGKINNADMLARDDQRIGWCFMALDDDYALNDAVRQINSKRKIYAASPRVKDFNTGYKEVKRFNRKVDCNSSCKDQVLRYINMLFQSIEGNSQPVSANVSAPSGKDSNGTSLKPAEADAASLNCRYLSGTEPIHGRNPSVILPSQEPVRINIREDSIIDGNSFIFHNCYKDSALTLSFDGYGKFEVNSDSLGAGCISDFSLRLLKDKRLIGMVGKGWQPQRYSWQCDKSLDEVVALYNTTAAPSPMPPATNASTSAETESQAASGKAPASSAKDNSKLYCQFDKGSYLNNADRKEASMLILDIAENGNLTGKDFISHTCYKNVQGSLSFDGISKFSGRASDITDRYCQSEYNFKLLGDGRLITQSFGKTPWGANARNVWRCDKTLDEVVELFRTRQTPETMPASPPNTQVGQTGGMTAQSGSVASDAAAAAPASQQNDEILALNEKIKALEEKLNQLNEVKAFEEIDYFVKETPQLTISKILSNDTMIKIIGKLATDQEIVTLSIDQQAVETAPDGGFEHSLRLDQIDGYFTIELSGPYGTAKTIAVALNNTFVKKKVELSNFILGNFTPTDETCGYAKIDYPESFFDKYDDKIKTSVFHIQETFIFNKDTNNLSNVFKSVGHMKALINELCRGKNSHSVEKLRFRETLLKITDEIDFKLGLSRDLSTENKIMMFSTASRYFLGFPEITKKNDNGLIGDIREAKAALNHALRQYLYYGKQEIDLAEFSKAMAGLSYDSAEDGVVDVYRQTLVDLEAVLTPGLATDQVEKILTILHSTDFLEEQRPKPKFENNRAQQFLSSQEKLLMVYFVNAFNSRRYTKFHNSRQLANSGSEKLALIQRRILDSVDLEDADFEEKFLLLDNRSGAGADLAEFNPDAINTSIKTVEDYLSDLIDMDVNSFDLSAFNSQFELMLDSEISFFAGALVNELSFSLDDIAYAISETFKMGIGLDLDAFARGLGFSSFQEAVDAYNAYYGTNYNVNSARDALMN